MNSILLTMRGCVLMATLLLCVSIRAAEEGSPAKTEEPKAETRLYEQDPFDLIVPKDTTQPPRKVLPLPFPNRQVPKNPPPKEELTIRFLEDPTESYAIAWHDIAEVKLFEQMLIEEVNGLVTAGRLDEAFDYFAHLKTDYPDLPGLRAGTERYLLEDAKLQFKQGNIDSAWAILEDLYRLNSRLDGLSEAYGQVVDALIEKYQKTGDLELSRRRLKLLDQHFPNHPRVNAWQEKWNAEAAKLVDQAKADVAASRWIDAQEASRAAALRQPTLAEARRIATEAMTRYPSVVVGTSAPLTSNAPISDLARLYDWSARRQDRLITRRLVEFVGISGEGGVYTSPVGTIERGELDQRVSFLLRPGIALAGKEMLTGYPIARRLLDRAQPNSDNFSSAWALLMASLQVREVYRVDVALRRFDPAPEALADVPLETWLAPYAVQSDSEQRKYLLNNHYFAAEPGQPRQITEKIFSGASVALAALARGEVSIVDRLNPWDVERTIAGTDMPKGEILVERYAIPTVHGLLPNLGRAFSGNRTFRRAVEYGLDRPAILARELLRGHKLAGCQVVSGPFSAGMSYEDPLRYAYNDEVKPRPYEPRLSMILSAAALAEVSAATVTRGEKKLEQVPALIIAHPADDVARVACREIRKQLDRVGMTVKLTELAPGVVWPENDDYDFLYAEITLREPLVDARRLLGSQGLIGNCSSYMSLALDALDTASNWRDIRPRLQQIHKQAADDVALIPLWQLTEHLAHHHSVDGLGREPVTLYQQIEQWHVQPRLPPEKP